jgi:hypothetical protein
MTRRWKDITGLEGRYQVSDDGYVRSLPDIDARGRFMPGVVLKHGVNENGYAHVSLAGKSYKVHRLVASAFVGGEGPQVNHIDGDKLHNHWGNLEWCDNAANHRHRYRVLGHKPAQLGKTGVNCANSKPVVAVWVSTGQLRSYFSSAAEAARECGVDSSGISMAARGQLRSYKGCRWAYITQEEYRDVIGAA